MQLVLEEYAHEAIPRFEGINHVQFLHLNIYKMDPNDPSETVTLKIKVDSITLSCNVGRDWSMSKLKCFLMTFLPILNLHEFDLISEGQTQHEDTQVGTLDPPFLRIKLLKETKNNFQAYYNHTMKQFYSQHLEKLPLGVPTLSPLYYSGIRNSLKQNPQNNPENEDNHPQPFRYFWEIITTIGVTLFLTQIWHKIALKHCAILFTISLIFFIIEGQIRTYRERTRNRAQPEVQEVQQREVGEQVQQREVGQQVQPQQQLQQQQRQPKTAQQLSKAMKQKQAESSDAKAGEKQLLEPNRVNMIMAKVVFCGAWLLECIYCFTISLFPNWILAMHLQANGPKMDKVENYIRDLEGN